MGREIWFNVSPENMSNKYYEPKAGIAMELKGKWDNINNLHYWQNKTILMNEVKEVCGVGREKARKIVDAFLAAGILEKKNNVYLVHRAKPPYVKFDVDTINYLLDGVSNDCLKVYCYLKNKWDIHCSYDYAIENYFFSNGELLRMMGYNDRQAANIKKITNILFLLEEDLKLIKYNHESVGRPGYHGVYHELLGVYDSATAKKAKEESEEEIKRMELEGQSAVKGMTSDGYFHLTQVI